VIKPTVGRSLWYYPGIDPIARVGDEPLAAILTAVLTDTDINLCVFDANGHPHPRQHVYLFQEGGRSPGEAGHAQWMPYQKGQSAKTEQLEAQLAAARMIEEAAGK
jgi:hypothetical protein